MQTTLTRDQQIRHIKKYQVLFDDAFGVDGPRDVAAYFREYADQYDRDFGPNGLYFCLCCDLDIDPQGIP